MTAIKKSFCLAVLVIWLPSFLAAKRLEKWPADPEPGQKIVKAVRTGTPVVLDGLLSEIAWQGEPVGGFTQNDPNDGQPSTEKTDVWIAYDDKALYVAAYCHDTDPQKILSRLGRRDAQVDSDWFMVAIDPYYDKRSGYLFGVNPAGSILDSALFNDVEEDNSWDGIWEWKAVRNGDGWNVEMRIPFNQIRFAKREEYVWGINFRRVIKRKNETASFSWVPKNEQGFVSRFARLEGLLGINPGRHIELLPYTVGQARFRPAEEGNPFATGQSFLGNAGFDLKVGLQANLTLDATVNPDFGQVEVDPAVVNLTAYETYYEEKRPFFIEGASIFDGFGRGGFYRNLNKNWPNPKFFYSRRVGRAPQGPVGGEGYVDFPDRTTILGAAKLTGKLGGWNIGFINALTAREFATVDFLGARSREEVEPFSYIGVFRAQKDIHQGRQGIGVMATGIVHDADNPVLDGVVSKNAFSLAVDGWTFLDSKGTYVVGGWVGATRVASTAEDILGLQRSSLHYYQRPDAAHVEVDPAATSLSGWGGRLQFAKQQGNLFWVMNIGALSPGFDPNDAGYQSGGSDLINIAFVSGYIWAKPGKIFQQSLLAIGGCQAYDFGGHKITEDAALMGQFTFRNFWSFNPMIDLATETLSNRLTRGGPLARTPRRISTGFSLQTDRRQPFVLSGEGYLDRSPKGGNGWSAGLTLNWKPSDTLSISIGPQYILQNDEYQWVGRFEDSLMTSTYGSRYVFGHVGQKIVSAELRVNWTFTPRLSLQAYLQPFIGVGRYSRFKELARPGSLAYNNYGENGSSISFLDGVYTVDPDGEGPAEAFAFGDPSFNVKSLRGTVVLRWEYRAGSLLYLVWTQNRADYAHPGDFRFGRDLGDLLVAPGDNIFMIKVSYRWDL